MKKTVFAAVAALAAASFIAPADKGVYIMRFPNGAVNVSHVEIEKQTPGVFSFGPVKISGYHVVGLGGVVNFMRDFDQSFSDCPGSVKPGHWDCSWSGMTFEGREGAITVRQAGKADLIAHHASIGEVWMYGAIDFVGRQLDRWGWLG